MKLAKVQFSRSIRLPGQQSSAESVIAEGIRGSVNDIDLLENGSVRITSAKGTCIVSQSFWVWATPVAPVGKK